VSDSTSFQRLRAVSYNIHSWKGADGAAAPRRIMDVIRTLDGDIVALQEVVSPLLAGERCSLREMADELGYNVAFGPTMSRRDSRYGNALLSKIPPARFQGHDLGCFDCEPRGAIDAIFRFGKATVRVVATHLGLKRRERIRQIRALRPLLTSGDADLALLMGDLNEWLPWGGAQRIIREIFGAAPSPRTFPSGLPLFALDRVHVRPATALVSLREERSALARKASDHLPLVAEISFQAVS